MQEPFTTPQVADILGLPTRKVLSFIERGYVSPSLQEAAGHGSKRLWSFCDLVHCLVASRLDTFMVPGYIRIVMEKLAMRPEFAEDHAVIIVKAPKESDQLVEGTRLSVKRQFVFTDVMFHLSKRESHWEVTKKGLEQAWPVHLVIDFENLHAWIRQRLVL